ncbi:efflux transporter outer membrane subunit [Comamonas sp. GB3 AK4-5]|uniref:efflux transporter outer membrane subunit n=1 Tax=Comamonas sp. GB3 AK4-5 TaxID=3231487 RepID=UPI00351E0F4C
MPESTFSPSTSRPAGTHRVVPAAAWAVAAAVSLVMAGCSHTTSLQPPQAVLTVPPQWQAAPPSQTMVAQSPQELSHWWQRFGDVQLTALIEQALQANPSLHSAEAAVRQARATRDVQGAGLLPKAGASAGSGRSRQGNNDARNSYSAGLDASWEPDWWGGQRNRVAAGEAHVQAAQATLEGVQVSLAAEVAQTYVQLRGQQDRLRIAEQNLALQQQTQRIAEWRVQAGLATSLEAEQARQSTYQTAAQLPALQSSLAQSRHALAILTGQPPAALQAQLQALQPVPQAPDDLALALPADTLRQRPDVRAAQHKVEAALANLSAQEVANYPSLRLSGSLGLSALTLGALTNGASVAASMAAGLSATLFDGGANRAQIRAQSAAVEQAHASYQAAVLTALQEVEDALVQLQGDKARLVQLRQAEAAARNASLLANQRYQSGLIDFQTVLDTQRTLLSSQDSVSTVAASIGTDHIRLYKALGGGWTPTTVADSAFAQQ